MPLDEPADATWVATRRGTDGATSLQRLRAGAGFEPRVSYRSNDYDVVRGFVRSCLCIALVPVLGHAPGAGVVAAARGERGAPAHVGVLTRADGRNPAVEGVIAALDRSARGCTTRRQDSFTSRRVRRPIESPLWRSETVTGGVRVLSTRLEHHDLGSTAPERRPLRRW